MRRASAIIGGAVARARSVGGGSKAKQVGLLMDEKFFNNPLRTEMALREMKECGLFDEAIVMHPDLLFKICADCEMDDEGKIVSYTDSRRHISLNKNNVLEEILKTPLRKLVNAKRDGVSAFEFALSYPDPHVATELALAMVNHVDDIDIAEKSIPLARERRKERIGGKSGYFTNNDSDARMPVDSILRRLIKILELEKKFGGRPKIFSPFFDNRWSPDPITMLKDHGLETENFSDHSVNFGSNESVDKLKMDVHSAVKESNGVLITGNNLYIDERLYSRTSETVDPALSGKRENNKRTFTEAITLKSAFTLGKPVWAICGGAQLAIVMLGGTLCGSRRKYDRSDIISVMPRSFLDPAKSSDDICESDLSDGEDEPDLRKMPAHSAHSEYADRVPHEYLDVVATNSGVDKAFQDKGRRFLFATQTHLEVLAKDRSARKAVGRFVTACAKDFIEERTGVPKPSSEIREAMVKKVTETIATKFSVGAFKN